MIYTFLLEQRLAGGVKMAGYQKPYQSWSDQVMIWSGSLKTAVYNAINKYIWWLLIQIWAKEKKSLTSTPNKKIWGFSKRSLDVMKLRTYVAPRENQSHYSVLIDLARQNCYHDTKSMFPNECSQWNTDYH